jgi:hypothetical protein
MNTKSAKCERTSQDVPLSNGYFVASTETGVWSFISKDAPEVHDDYFIPVKDVVKSPEAIVDWMAHLTEMSWFDANKLFDFFTRFRKENNLFKSL